MFAKLLKVRKVKSDKAERAVRQAKNLLLQAEKDHETAIEVLETFRRLNTDLEARLLEGAMRRGNSKFVFDDMRFEIAESEKKERKYEQDVKNAEQARQKAEQKVEQAKLAFKATLRDIDKTDQLLSKTKNTELKEAERAAESALEDVPRPAPGI